MTSLNDNHSRDGSLGVSMHRGSKQGNSNGNGRGRGEVATMGSPMLRQSFPAAILDPAQQLSALRDNHSAYSAVAKSCLHLSQYAGNGSHASSEDTGSVQFSSLFHDTAYAETMNTVFAALMECIKTHDDRRARIAASRTLAFMARSTYARIRHSPHLFAMRESVVNRLEDDVGTEVPTALCTAALDDPDEGVAATALESLGIMTLSSLDTPGTLVEDELTKEILSLTSAKAAPHAPTLSQISDEDPTIPQTELQSRIFGNVIAPRLLQLVCRATAFESFKNVERILPMLTASLVHQSKVMPLKGFGMDRTTHTKRWGELDFVSMVDDIINDLLIPMMRSHHAGHVAKTVALCTIRLIHACPQASWIEQACQWTLLVLQEDYAMSRDTEARMSCLAAMLICCRAQDIGTRSTALRFIAEKLISDIPSTKIAPPNICSAGLMLQARGVSQYRIPARAALLAEICLSFLVDGQGGAAMQDTTNHSKAFDAFMKSTTFAKAIKETQDGKPTAIREEIILAFCMAAVGVGRSYRQPRNSKKSGHLVVTSSQENFDEWQRMSVSILNAFETCVGWGSSPSYMEEEITLTVAAQASYVRLVQELLHGSGLLGSVSVSLRMAPTASPPNMLWDQMEESAAFLGRFDAVGSSTFMPEPISSLLHKLVQKEIKGQGIVSHHMRLFLLSLAADSWVQARYHAIQGDYNSSGSQASISASDIDLKGAKDLLQALSPRRVFSKVVESQKGEFEQYTKKKKELYKKYAQDTVTVCVACIENIALSACDWRKRFGASDETKQILTSSVISLQGKSGDAESQAPVLPVCQGAIERIQAQFSNPDASNPDALSLSPLVTNVNELERRPVVTAARSQQGPDMYKRGYLTQMLRQVIAGRIDQATLSLPTVYSLNAPVRKQNFLRLSTPPLPEHRISPVSMENIPRFAWLSNVSSVTGGSDASSVMLAYSMRRNLRYDGENEFRLSVSMRLHNTTPVDIENGVRLQVGIAQEDTTSSLDAEDTLSMEILEALRKADEAATSENVASLSATTTYKHELKAGDHITWDVCLETFPLHGVLSLHPSIVYRDIEVEQASSDWQDEEKKDSDSSKADSTDKGKAASGESGGNNDNSNKNGDDEVANVVFYGESLRLSPLIGVQPCPFVFFRDGSGDIETFRFLWSRMPHQIHPLRLVKYSQSETSADDENYPVHNDARRIAAISSVRFGGESIPRGQVTRLWAFMSLQGQRVFCVLAHSAEAGSAKSSSGMEPTLHIRSDDVRLMQCLVGTKWARAATVSALVPHLQPAPIKETSRGSV